jgi:hypothetical protein
LIEIHVSELLKFYNTDYRDILKLLIDNEFTIEKVESHRSNKKELTEITATTKLEGNVMILCKKH